MNTSVNTPANVNTNRVNNAAAAAKIEDFGQKIGGARKDYYAQLRELADILAGIDCEALKKSSLSKLVKLPDLARLFEAGALTADAARALLTIWRTIPARPSRPYRLARWAEETAEKVAQCASLLNGGAVDEKTRTRLDFQILEVANWPAQPFSFGRFSVAGPDWFASDYRVIAGNYYYSRCAKLEDVPAAISAAIAKDSEKRAEGPALAVYCTRAGQYFVAVKDKAEIILATFDTVEEARAARDNDRAALLEKYDQIRTIPAMRREWNRPRVGQDWRKGQDITPATFAEVLPFRGVEFGNWVNQTERAALLNSAFDGFHDLAQVWGLTAEEMTLNGSLAFAFASRGIGSAAAHYEPGREVINLTKKNGAGCMAHEWFHALDAFAGAQDGREDCKRYQTEHPADSERGEAARALMVAIKKTDFYRRSLELTKYSKKGAYWVENCELAARGFEGVCGVILNAAGICSDFLVNLESMDAFTAKDALHRSDIYPYPSEAEAAELLPYYLDFLRLVFGHAEVSAEALQMAAAATDKAEAERAEAAKVRAIREAEKKAAEEAKAKAERERIEAELQQLNSKADAVAAIWSIIAGVKNCRRLVSGSGVGVIGWWDAQIIVTHITQHEAQTMTAEQLAERVAVLQYKRTPARRKNVQIHSNGSVDFCKWNAEEFLNWFDEEQNEKTGCRFAALAFKYGRKPANFRADAEKVAADLARLKEEQAQKWAREREKEAEQTNTKAEAKKPVRGEENAAPADCLQLVEIAGGMAIVPAEGYDYRATLFNRRQIKAHGATWNREAQQWQATDPATVEALRAWFAQFAPAADEQPEAEAAAPIYSECEKSEEPQQPEALAALPEWLKVGALVMTAPAMMTDSRTMRPVYVEGELMRVSKIDAEFVHLEHPTEAWRSNSIVALSIAAQRLSPAPVADEQQEQSEPEAIAASYGSEPETPETSESENALYSESEKSEEWRKHSCPLYSFSFGNRSAELCTVFNDVAEGEKWLQRAAEGVGALSVDACDFLDCQADYIIYFSRRSGEYICTYLADHEGTPLCRPIEELRRRVLNAREDAETKQIAQGIEDADREGCAYEKRARNSVIRVERDPRHIGRYRVTWYVSGEIDERRSNQTAESVAPFVWLFCDGHICMGDDVITCRPNAHYSDSAKSELPPFELPEGCSKGDRRTKTRGQIYKQYFRILDKLAPGGQWSDPRSKSRADRILNALNRYANHISKTAAGKMYLGHASNYLPDGRNPIDALNALPIPRYVYMGRKFAA